LFQCKKKGKGKKVAMNKLLFSCFNDEAQAMNYTNQIGSKAIIYLLPKLRRNNMLQILIKLMDETILKRQLQNGRIYFNVQVMNLLSIDHITNDPT
jgi:hypothetical protein